MELLNKLIARNITGNVGWQSLREYGLGIALGRQIVHDKVI